MPCCHRIHIVDVMNYYLLFFSVLLFCLKTQLILLIRLERVNEWVYLWVGVLWVCVPSLYVQDIHYSNSFCWVVLFIINVTWLHAKKNKNKLPSWFVDLQDFLFIFAVEHLDTHSHILTYKYESICCYYIKKNLDAAGTFIRTSVCV